MTAPALAAFAVLWSERKDHATSTENRLLEQGGLERPNGRLSAMHGDKSIPISKPQLLRELRDLAMRLPVRGRPVPD